MRLGFVHAAALAGCFYAASCAPSIPAQPERVLIDAMAPPVNVFDPHRALGGVLDGMPAGRVGRFYTPHNVHAMQGAGLRSVSYGLRTELAIEAWHWSEEGAWSDAAHHQGYWTGNDNPVRPVLSGWGYQLPRRGDSVDQANDNGYSRLDDGDLNTFWKSNPYLDSRYTHARARPQWVIVSLARKEAISRAHIVWARPYARAYEVQYWSVADPYDDHGRWIDFPNGNIADGQGGDADLRLSPTPIETQFVRILLTISSKTAAAASTDPRDRLGYAIGEIGVGATGVDGQFTDAVRHSMFGRVQTNMYVSSTDPWHRASDRDVNVEQPGFDRIISSGLANNLPMMIPVGPLYDTPENAAAEIRFLKRRRYPVRQVEVGVEPDGQNVAPEDFAALYAQFAAAARSADPGVSVGGPSLQDAVSDTWLDPTADHSWTRRFIAALDTSGHRADLGFFTFEHYPFDVPCGRPGRILVDADEILRADLARLRQDGVPDKIPWVITEFGLSAFSGQREVEVSSALFNADFTAHFLTLGGSAVYLLGYGPDKLYPPENECAGYGELMLFGEDQDGQASWPTPNYWAATMLTRDWAQKGGGAHALYHASVNGSDPAARAAVVAYPLKRPDGGWAVLLINRDPGRAHVVSLSIVERAHEAPRKLPGPYEIVQYGEQQYAWHSAGPAGRPVRNEPPNRFRAPAGPVVLPPYSLTIVRASASRGG